MNVTFFGLLFMVPIMAAYLALYLAPMILAILVFVRVREVERKLDLYLRRR